MSLMRLIYRRLPIPRAAKRSIKRTLFQRFPRLFRHTNVYHQWLATEGRPEGDGDDVDLRPSSGDATLRSYAAQILHRSVERNACAVAPLRFPPQPDRKPSVRSIAFYLPQFHPIPENDAWWGPGFTEWTNVTKAVPQFVGHYQPHLPGDLGFYDLRQASTIQRQIELARFGGVEGFCIYYYWFAGKRLLNAPLDLFAEIEKSFPFCICWANENWTRRWDGLDTHVLMAQEYDERGGPGPIEDMLQYLRCPNYLRIGGRPLIVIYRLHEIPAVAEMIRRWREICRNAGLGEIFVAAVRHEEHLDPTLGVDAAVDFPPHRIASGLPPRNRNLPIVAPGYAGYVVDYEEIVQRSVTGKPTHMPCFRGVMPGWDNEARKPGRGFTVHGSNPAIYRAWLRQMGRSARAHPVSGESVVFVNAWNEWAEGAHLEPDRRFGYGYLRAHRQAVCLPDAGAAGGTPKRICVIVHAFYPELLAEILQRIGQWSVPWRLIVTTPQDKVDTVREILGGARMQAEIIVVANRGRDILPFLKVLARGGFDDEIILKLHTKRSLHRQDGEHWRMELVNTLADPVAAVRMLEAFQRHPDLGVIGPSGHCLSLSRYWGKNAANVAGLCERMELPITDLHGELFVAGSMFYVRPQALRKLVQLQLSEHDFEAEAGQVDGTMAHAIERCFAMLAWSEGYALASSAAPDDIVLSESSSYAFAEASDEDLSHA